MQFYTYVDFISAFYYFMHMRVKTICRFYIRRAVLRTEKRTPRAHVHESPSRKREDTWSGGTRVFPFEFCRAVWPAAGRLSALDRTDNSDQTYSTTAVARYCTTPDPFLCQLRYEQWRKRQWNSISIAQKKRPSDICQPTAKYSVFYFSCMRAADLYLYFYYRDTYM